MNIENQIVLELNQLRNKNFDLIIDAYAENNQLKDKCCKVVFSEFWPLDAGIPYA